MSCNKIFHTAFDVVVIQLAFLLCCRHFCMICTSNWTRCFFFLTLVLLLFWLDDGGVSSEEGFSTGDGDAQEGQSARVEDRELKDSLLRKFGSHIGSLKLEFSKKKKRGKLPKDSRQTLLQWWNLHYKWPYPTVSIPTLFNFTN